MQTQYDFMVIGAGSAGYAAARTARDAGASVGLVDPGPLGGLCILRGCMPSKTLIATGDLAYEIAHAHELGLTTNAPRLDFDFVMRRKREVIKGFADYRIDGIDKFPLISGNATFTSPYKLDVDGTSYEAKTFLIATGSVVAPAAIPGLREAGFIDSDQALALSLPPESLIVLGGGYVGSELGQFYSRIGVPTTFLIRSGQLLTNEDADVGEALTSYFREEGIRVETHAIVQRVTVDERGLKVVHFEQNGEHRTAAAHEIFYALGRTPNVADLNLEAAGVEYHAITGIAVDDTMRTTCSHIFAAGDVTGRFALVHIAIQQGEVAARNAIAGTHEQIDYSLSKTHAVFTDPQVAVVGETEKELKAAGTTYLMASAPFNDHGKAIAIGKTKGFVKLIASPEGGRIVGAAIVGPHASDLIHEVIVAMNYQATVFEFMRIPHLHPTMAEILTEPAEELASKLSELLTIPATVG